MNRLGEEALSYWDVCEGLTGLAHCCRTVADPAKAYWARSAGGGRLDQLGFGTV